MMARTRDQMAARVAADISSGWFVNLGIGMPTLVANFIPAGRDVILHSENGILNVGPKPAPGMEDPELINAGKAPVTILPGGSYFETGLSFAMMRGGHLDLAVLGAYEVSANGDLANWTTGESGAPPAVGGAMDLASGAKVIWVLMEHTTRDGRPRIVERCQYPLTAKGVVRRIFTDLAVIEISNGKLLVTELVDGLSFDQLQAVTGARLIPAETLSSSQCSTSD
jgi:3-oxoadipate CoA-transferase beta subunit